MNNTRLNGAISLALAAVLAAGCSGQDDAPAEAEPVTTNMGDNGMAMSSADNSAMEECYGISVAGQNDGTADEGIEGQGTSVIDYQGNAWTYVDEGTCTTTERPDGTMGSLTPIDNVAG